ncbi:uncharacterized protein N7496_009843 [Penicillium cataractarum]|uniref:PXA domain-containing protein n=1 Tax=Penicillium cataractarum TaxID=2100454 RepID=A0A9W9RPQ2_9EURO|nr:uncharacterized protein N7496_009843 [Penicillium cataractarum]KAJ5364130.1 hypothetical protein N7496_009843 [Penicillium cataractarum]
MNDPLRPGLQPVSHLKAGPTTSSSRSTALPSSGQPPLTRPSSRLRAQRPSIRDDTTDATSDKATAALIRRVLSPQPGSGHGASSPQPSEELLPPLTSSNDVDRQLYAILAVIIREFVHSWYTKITPDQALVDEVLQVIAHCTRALEQRIRQVDVTQLALDEIPALVEAHILSYRLAKERSHLSGLPTSHRALYHELNPHPGLSPVPDPADPDTVNAQAENEAVYRRLLASGTLAVLLPTEDLENSSLRQLVSDILSDLILGKEISGRVCQGWFLWEAITKVTEAVRRRKTLEHSESANDVPTNRLERFGLLTDEDDSTKSHASAQSRATGWIWSVLQNIYLGYVALRFIATGLFRVASDPRQGYSHGASVSFPAATPGFSKKEGGFDSSPSSDGVPTKRPVLDYRVYSMISQLLGISQRMPWLSGLFALAQHLILAGPGRLGDTDGILDRFLRETIEEYILPPTLLPNLLLATRSALFPANARPTSQAPAGNTGPALAPAPQASVQPPAPSGKSPLAVTVVTTSAPFPEGSRVSSPGASDAVGKSNISSSNSNSKSSTAVGVGSGGDRLQAGLPPRSSTVSPSSPTIATRSDIDTVQQASTEVSTGPENRLGPSPSEIAAIKRRCAASLLAVIPLKVARTLFGVPPPSSSDRTCSAATGNSPFTTSEPSPPPSLDGDGGGCPRSSLQDKGTTPSSQASPLSSSAPTLAGLTSESGDYPAAQRTDEGNEESDIDLEELYFLEAIETDLLDLLADEYCNKHLVYSIIETALARVLPELTERTVEDLMEDRGVTPVPGGF